MSHDEHSDPDRWAYFRFTVIGPLLSSPPEPGALQEELAKLAQRRWRHPVRPERELTLGLSTIERWYYQARKAQDPIATLRRKAREDLGEQRSMKPELVTALEKQYRAHPSWSYQLHYDNLLALVSMEPLLGEVPTYATVRRLMQKRGWYKQAPRPRHPTLGQVLAAERRDRYEIRLFEASHVHALWHTDFHHGSLRVVDEHGQWHVPKVLCILDDCSRVCCHIQWYLYENTQNFVHAITQAFYKRGLPRAFMSDNGAPMTAGETTSGLKRLAILPETTLAYSPYQNGKQEHFWALLEGHLLRMLEGVSPLTLPFLNEVTQAWAELEYNRRHHSELDCSPLARLLKGPEVSREAPSSDEMTRAFTVRVSRTQRRSDGTLTLKGVRFELPSHLRTLARVMVRYRSWDLTRAFVVDERTDALLAVILPVDKQKNADGRRKLLSSPEPSILHDKDGVIDDPLPPLLRKLVRDYAATGLPPAYLPQDECSTPSTQNTNHQRPRREEDFHHDD